jgi:hypothetical protein
MYTKKKNANVNASAFTGVILRKPKLVSPKVTYLDVQNVEDGRTLQWVVFNANFENADLKKMQFAKPESVIKILGTDNVNAKTGQDQIVIQKLLSVSDATESNTFADADTSTNILNELLMQETLGDLDAHADNALLINQTWIQLNALMARVPKQKAIGMLAKQIAVLNGETSNV